MPVRDIDKWERYKIHGDKNARAELIREFVPLVYFVLKRMTLRMSAVLDHDDLIAAGTIGLIAAVNDFDISRGFCFTTFAVLRIRGAILDELRNHDWVPRTARRRATDLRNAMEKASYSTPDRPDMAKVAKILKMSASELGCLMNATPRPSFMSLDNHDDGAEDQIGFGELVADRRSPAPDDQVEHTDQLAALRAAFKKLPKLERSVLTQYHFQARMQKDIARKLGVSRSRVSQIHSKAIAYLQEELCGRKDNAFASAMVATAGGE